MVSDGTVGRGMKPTCTLRGAMLAPGWEAIGSDFGASLVSKWTYWCLQQLLQLTSTLLKDFKVKSRWLEGPYV